MKTRIIIAVAMLVAVATSALADYNGARVATVAVGGGATVKYITYNGGDSAANCPKAFLIWSGDGAVIWIRRNVSGSTAFEDIPIKIPADTPVTIPVFSPWYNSGAYYHFLEINAKACTDSVFVLPLDK